MMKSVWVAAGVILGFVYMCSQASCDSTGYGKPEINDDQLELAEKYIASGVRYAEKNAYRKAISEFKKAVDISPQLFNARYNIACTYYKMGKVKEAVGNLEMINADFKDNIAAHNMIGQILVDRGKEEQAIEYFKTAVGNGEAILKKAEIPQAKVDIAMAYHNLGSMYVKAGDLEDAEDNLKKSVEANDSNYYSHYALGALLVKMGKYKEAKDELKKARELNINFVQSDIEMARAHLMGDPPNVMAAISTLREAMRKDADNPEIHELLGHCYIVREQTDEKLKLDDYREAVKYYRSALNLDKDSSRYRILLARACTLAGEHDTAEKVLEKLKKKEELPEKLRKQMHLVDANIHKVRKEWAQAAEQYALAFEIDPSDHAACLEAGKCYYEAKDFKRAEECLDGMLTSYGDEVPEGLADKFREAREMLLEIRKSQE